MLKEGILKYEVSMFQFLLLALTFTSFSYAQIYRPTANLDVQYNIDTYGKTAKDIQAMGLQEYAKFLTIDVNHHQWNVHYNRDINKPKTITQEQASRVMDAASTNPVVALYQRTKYDPKEQGIGFCFGRAMFVDLYTAMNGLDRGSIKKAFVVGPMSGGGSMIWGWHVTTIVQSKDRAGREMWLAIDPVVGTPMEVTAWYKYWLRSSTNGKLKLYITESGKFSQMAYRYDYSTFNHPFYNNYFTDMLKWFQNNDVSRELQLH